VKSGDSEKLLGGALQRGPRRGARSCSEQDDRLPWQGGEGRGGAGPEEER
jgi:hypothetical protein